MIYRILFIVLVLFGFSAYASIPGWYKLQNIPSKNFEIIGYGEGKTLSEAMTNAKSDIADQLFSEIKSKVKINRTLKDGNFSRNLQQSIESTSDIRISHVDRIKTDNKDGKYYVAVKYVNLPIYAKVKKDFGKTACLSEKENNKYILSTYFAKEFKSNLGCVPKINFYSNNSIWFAEINGNSYFVDNVDFIKLFTDFKNKNIKIIPSKKHLKAGEIYHFILYPQKRGYLSLYQISNKGDVSLFIDNEEVVEKMELIYPNLDEYEGLEALVVSGSRDIDLNLSVLCKNKINNAVFSTVSTEYVPGFGGFGRLIELINSCEISTVVTEIKK